MHQHILLPTDGSELSEQAVNYGVALATALYVAGNNNSIFDAGSILGSIGSGGLFGDAVELAGNNNRFELQDGAGFHGNVVSTGQNNIFALGGAANGTFDLSSIVSSITFCGSLLPMRPSRWDCGWKASFDEPTVFTHSSNGRSTPCAS